MYQSMRQKAICARANLPDGILMRGVAISFCTENTYPLTVLPTQFYPCCTPEKGYNRYFDKVLVI